VGEWSSCIDFSSGGPSRVWVQAVLVLLAVLLHGICAAQNEANLSLSTPSSDQPACVYRNGFHVPEPLRKEGEPFRWGVLGPSTPIRLKVVKKASSGDEAGDKIELEVAEDVLVDGFAVIRKGAEAWGAITNGGDEISGEVWRSVHPHSDLPVIPGDVVDGPVRSRTGTACGRGAEC
jgi:hypothetical protein